MLQQYQNMLNSYKLWYPSLYEKTVECRPCGRYSIMVRLDDGTRMEYDDLDHTIRDVSRFYNHDDSGVLDEDTWKKEFGRTLRRLISERGMTQERLSDITGISRQMLTRYVRGNSIPSGYVLSRLAVALDCDVRELTRFGYIDEE